MDRFADIQTFVAIVETGSFSRAAERLDVAKSAVSRRLAELEEHLGVQLFQRTTRRLNLTDAGRGFYGRCVRIVADLDEAEHSVSREHGSLQGSLRVAVPLSFGLLHLGSVITDFMALHPAIRFELDFNDRHVDLLREGVDVAVRIAQLSDSSLIARRIATIRHLVCASPAYLAAHGSPVRPADLERHECLVYANAPEPGRWAYRAPDGSKGTVRGREKLRADNGDFLCAAAVAGQGVIMEPAFIVHAAIARGELVALFADYRWPRLNMYAVYPRTRHLSTRVRAFVDYLAGRFSGTPPWEHASGIAGLSSAPAATAASEAGQ
jgi:DNA-binding transcriptional LysR family regulator